MRAILRGVLLGTGILTAFLFISAEGRGELTSAGRETIARIGAVSPWFEYESTPRGWDFQVNLVSWSSLFGLVSACCFWARSRLLPMSPSPTTAVDRPAAALEMSSTETI